jgi:hypothetical protein
VSVVEHRSSSRQVRARPRSLVSSSKLPRVRLREVRATSGKAKKSTPGSQLRFVPTRPTYHRNADSSLTSDRLCASRNFATSGALGVCGSIPAAGGGQLSRARRFSSPERAIGSNRGPGAGSAPAGCCAGGLGEASGAKPARMRASPHDSANTSLVDRSGNYSWRATIVTLPNYVDASVAVLPSSQQRSFPKLRRHPFGAATFYVHATNCALETSIAPTKPTTVPVGAIYWTSLGLAPASPSLAGLRQVSEMNP